jgi:hypothetical protein
MAPSPSFSGFAVRYVAPRAFTAFRTSVGFTQSIAPWRPSPAQA